MPWWKALTKQNWTRRLRPWAAAATTAEPAWNPQRTWRGLQVLAVVVLVAILLAGYRPAQRALRAYVAQRHTAPITARQVRFVAPPAWMPPYFQERLGQLVAEQFARDPLDKQGPLLAVRALYQSGWVARVDSVQRVAGGVKVKAQFRQPTALVRVGDKFLLVDDQAVLLPGEYQGGQLAFLKLPVIVGLRSLGTMALGQPCADPRIGQALNLIAALRGEVYYHQVRAVDVSQQDALHRARLELLTDQGRVVWGLPVGAENHVEPPAALKKQMLTEIYRRKGAIDAGGAVVEVDGPAPYIRIPASDRPASTMG